MSQPLQGPGCPAPVSQTCRDQGRTRGGTQRGCEPGSCDGLGQLRAPSRARPAPAARPRAAPPPQPLKQVQLPNWASLGPSYCTLLLWALSRARCSASQQPWCRGCHTCHTCQPRVTQPLPAGHALTLLGTVSSRVAVSDIWAFITSN